YRVIGSKHLKSLEVEKAVYPYLGPERSFDDIEQARAALEKAYRDAGYQTVSVQVAAPPTNRGIVVLQVVEATVGRLRVKGSRYFLPSDIKKKAESMKEGGVPNFTDVTRDVVALNKLADLRVTPALRAGVEPGTVDIDLNVKDTLPLHGAIELNNRYSADTTPLRLNGSISYSNLWQLGHTINASFQVAPERPADATVYSAYYFMPFPGVENLSLMFQGTKQDSNVSTLGGAAVAGKGQILGVRAVVTLPPREGFFHSLSFGWDYKHFDENVTVGGEVTTAPIDYYPFTVAYGTGWTTKKTFTELNASMNWSLRGVGSDPANFDYKRYNSDGSYLYFRGDASHTHDLPGGFQAFVKVQGQASSAPLINSEQFAGGGLSTVRGYLEATALGDNGIFGTVELRSPSLLRKLDSKENEWRVYAFYDGGHVTLIDPLPEQTDNYTLQSFGFGTRLKLMNHINASLDAGMPLVKQANAELDQFFLTFRVQADF
ncbi:MAG: ShlB/FhaC/HecB family hemolysin secretion/activation protein, partial [Verrucomicrobia bacterium]|nr:ShlB/FhaC/HecB family hemolysin secretion/activation protein [Verrucomicrobiota bacterium]